MYEVGSFVLFILVLWGIKELFPSLSEPETQESIRERTLKRARETNDTEILMEE